MPNPNTRILSQFCRSLCLTFVGAVAFAPPRRPDPQSFARARVRANRVHSSAKVLHRNPGCDFPRAGGFAPLPARTAVPSGLRPVTSATFKSLPAAETEQSRHAGSALKGNARFCNRTSGDQALCAFESGLSPG